MKENKIENAKQESATILVMKINVETESVILQTINWSYFHPHQLQTVQAQMPSVQ